MCSLRRSMDEAEALCTPDLGLYCRINGIGMGFDLVLCAYSGESLRYI